MSAEFESASVASVQAQAEASVALAPPIDSQFLFVDVAAQRAKPLRRGALRRLPERRSEVSQPIPPGRLVKLERVAVEEVSRGFIQYALPGAEPLGEETA